jgi:sugar diacid utilization regulator
VRDILEALRHRQVRILAGEQGLARPVSWASTMRARLPAFEGFRGGELALLSLAVLRSLRAQVSELSLPAVVEQLAEIGISAIAVAGLSIPGSSSGPSAEVSLSADDARALAEAQTHADRLSLPLLGLPAGTPLSDVEREIIAHVVAGMERPRPTATPSDSYVHLKASLRGEALDALLTGTYAGEATMRARAAQLGYDLTQPHAVLWIELTDMDPNASPSSPAHPPSASPAAAELADALTAGLGAWARPRDAQVAALLPLPLLSGAGRGTADLAERASTLLARTLGASDSAAASWSAGLGEPAATPAQVHRSATEARDAARLGLVVFGPRRLTRPADLGVYRLLLALRDSGSLAPFVERTLAPLHADARNGAELVKTLDAFFACNGNLSQAALRLHLHRNSLLYRLHRARELLGHDLDDPELRLALQLAIKGQRVLEL